VSFYLCPGCDGSGLRNIFSGETCFTCHGVGMVEDADPDDEYDVYDMFDDECLSPEEQKQQSAMERGDYLRDRAKDESAENRLKGLQ
jgi:RecJ-like exonuclease